MTTSPDLGIPFIDQQQSQPEVTHNEALLLIQALLGGVISVGLNTPAVGPTIGDSYVIGAAPTGAWTGRANCVAIWSGTAWDFIPGETSAGTPITMGARQEGMRVWDKATDALYIWSGSAWSALATGGGQTGVASSLASGDYLLTNRGSMGWGTAAPSGSVLAVQMVYIDAEIECTGVAVNCTATGTTLDISIYEFLGAGNPGTAIATAQIDVTSTGIRTASFSGGNETLAPGAYFMTLRSITTSPTITSGTASSEGSGMDIMLLTSDALLNGLTGTAERVGLFVTDANLPGGSWSSGMDLTSLTLSNSTASYTNTLYRVALVKA